MPKFVSGSSGHIYGPQGKTKGDDQTEEEEVTALVGASERSDNSSSRKPSAINKRGTKEQQKSSLDLFKEELRKLNEEREEQRNKLKKSLADGGQPSSSKSHLKPQIVPVPLKPDPRCPTSLTLQVNLNPRDREASMGGSHDNGDPATTNIYVGNINPTVNENDLCDLFGRYGPLASIKIMWPRTDEEKARNRNSGFVAYMSRIDADRAIKALNGKEFRGYDMKLAVPIPQNPVYVPPEMMKLTQPPPQSGLPFNGQLHEDDIKRNYIVPNPLPRPLPTELESQVATNAHLRAIKETYDEFIQVVQRSTVRVVPPSDRKTLDRIHKTIEYVLREGPVFEAILIARENKNPLYSFLYDNRSQEHIYYRWKLYSLLHGDSPLVWRTEEFRMFQGGATWRPPPLNPYADGMPSQLIDEPDGLLIADKRVQTNNQRKTSKFSEGSMDLFAPDSTRKRGHLGEVKREILGDLLRNLDPTKAKIGNAMMFCINHSDAAREIVDCIHESLQLLETPFQRKIARLFLISDILHNCSAAVTNASFYRKGFQAKLVPIFEHLREYLVNIEDRYKADKFKLKVLSVLGAWKEWTLYEDGFVIRLSNILLGIKPPHQVEAEKISTVASLAASAAATATDIQFGSQQPSLTATPTAGKSTVEEDLDGDEVDEETLIECLEAKGLSLRWYMTLELSGDEAEEDPGAERSPSTSTSTRDRQDGSRSPAGKADERVRFKTSKWETVDPSEVAEQAVTIKKWEELARAEESGETDSSSQSAGSPVSPSVPRAL